MKKITLLFSIILIIGCHKDDDGITALPAATQTGARTFGCMVDGVAFIHEGGGINCFYQYVNGGHSFHIQGEQDNKNPSSISVGTIHKDIAEGETYPLLDEVNGNALANMVFSYSPIDYYSVNTDHVNSGELTITKLDFENNIVSGTFWFNVLHPVTGRIVEVREGRFDSFFSQ